MRYIVVNQNYIYEYDCGLTCGHEEYSIARSFNILFWLCNPFCEGFKTCESLLSEWAKCGCHVYLTEQPVKNKASSIRQSVQDTACCYSCCIQCFKVWTGKGSLRATSWIPLLIGSRRHMSMSVSPTPRNPCPYRLNLCSSQVTTLLKAAVPHEENDDVLMREASKVAEWRTWYLLIQSEKFQNKPRAVFSQHLRSYFLNMHAITCPQNMVWWNVVYTTSLLVWLSLAKWLATLITHSGDRWSVRRSRVVLFLSTLLWKISQISFWNYVSAHC